MRILIYSIATAIANLGFYVSYAVSAALYPGGTWGDASVIGHDFWRNYLCDVMKKTAHNGLPNPGQGYGFLSFGLLFATILCWWALLLKLLPDHLSRQKKIARIAAWLSAAGFVGMVIFPASESLISAHFFSVLVGTLFGLVVTILLYVYFLKVPSHRFLGKIGLFFLSPAVITLVIFTAYHLGVTGLSEGLIIVLEKLVILITSVLCLLSAFRSMQMAKARISKKV